MAANNEIGTLSALTEIGDICSRFGIAFHSDASQMVGKLPVSMEQLQLTMLSLSGHKLYAPKGVGVLAFRRNSLVKKLSPLLDGGGHERGMRSGTLNVPGIVGLGEAIELARTSMTHEAQRVGHLRNMFEQRLLQDVPDCFVNGYMSDRLPNISSIGFAGIDAESLLLALDGIAASTGSACTSLSIEPSHVLKSLHLSLERAKSAVRFSFGRQTTLDEVNRALDQIIPTIVGLRSLRSDDLI
jgi:cysteine desulfurase